ncbi:LOW QUALITY PROTEIN: sodium/hydrogen exchanger 8-like [Capsicum annuum]|uniref:LOW QUALITY PROTEIN: sodium/hydrogen exchanger 8-like n=3 Tax=Capsicum annuum TaxID=4072 RepID=UPI001FB06108|nr:LOW QUALITY PROTEIN: sodium/hydrogen exchanger 8-like [Capsicum annuum]
MEESTTAESSGSDPTNAVIFVGISLLLGIACRHVLRGTRVPYSVALLVLGIGLGALEYGSHHRLGRIGDGIRIWANINPDLLLAVFLPALLFESAFSMEIHQIKRCAAQMILLAGPGIVISTFFLGAAFKIAFPYNWSWSTSLLLGGLLSATDPVAVVALLKELGASKKLGTIIEGESLVNDGTAIVVYQLLLRIVTGWTFNWGAVIKFLVQVSLGAVGVGIAFGMASVLWLRFIFNDTVIEISLTLAVSYVSYFTAQQGADISGVLTVMTLGMFYSAVAKTAFKGESQQSLHHFWEMVSYIANTLIFILSGVVIAEGILGGEDIFKIYDNSWGYLVLLYVLVLVSRPVVVGVLYPFLRYFGYGLDWKEAFILVWGGLRGAVALSLSLSIKRSSDGSEYISSGTGTLFVFLTGGVVFLTLIINGSTTQFALHFLGMDKLSAAKKRILNYTKYKMLNKALEAFGDLGDDEELGRADWPTVKRYINSLNDVGGEPVHPHSSIENGDNVDHMHLKDIRIRLLNGVQAAYWEMLNEGRIPQTVANLLMLSLEEAIDVVSHEPLCDWKGLRSYVHIPNYFKFLQTSFVPRKLVTYFSVERLESACYICAGFLRAHRTARQQLNEFIGNTIILSTIMSAGESEIASRFLSNLRVLNGVHIQVIRVVKTRQVTYAVLNHLIDYVHNLEKIGILEEKEMTHLHDVVQTDLKRLVRNPPLVKFPKVRDLIRVNPLLGALPPSVRKTLIGSTKEIMKSRGATLYEEGSRATRVWLISNGVVKWSSKSASNMYLLHPTFSHGSTLGLYEVLVGKPYICDIIMDSVVLCFSVDSERIFTALRSDPAIEDFFWQESALVLAKVLLPHTFEKTTMQDMRALVAERSTMSVYIRGESFEIPHHSIGFLLVGFVKANGSHEGLLSAPAALLPSSWEQQSFHNSKTSGVNAASFSHQPSRYHVETRARVIIFDVAGFQTGRSLQRRSSSLLSHSMDRASRSFSRELGGLMSWPENTYKAMQRRHDGEQAGQQETNMSTRAMQLNIFGSMISNTRRRLRSFPGIGAVKTSHSQGYKKLTSHSHSYPEVRSDRVQTLVSVRSEGSTTLLPKGQVQGDNEDICIQLLSAPTEESHTIEDSSDDSGGEDEHLIRIDSGRPSFPQWITEEDKAS